MKKLILPFFVFLSLLTHGQDKPVAVDNSRYFPPATGEHWDFYNSQSTLIYLLKSSIWNKKFNLDPYLPENQFSYGFLSHQLYHPTAGNLNVTIPEVFENLKELGTVHIDEFPNYEDFIKKVPDYRLREKALAYKSKKLHFGSFYIPGHYGDLDLITDKVNSLKDSLANGTSFLLEIDIMEHYYFLGKHDSIYNYNGHGNQRIWSTIPVVVIGYNDTIRTVSGRGAFLMMGNNKDREIFYYDYNWFFNRPAIYNHYFLEENFSYQPELALHLNLTGSYDMNETYGYKYVFPDILLLDTLKYALYDYLEPNPEYRHYRGLAQIIEVNGRLLPQRSKQFLLPYSSGNGSYELLIDFTELTSASEFDSIKVLITEPRSAKYIGWHDVIINEFERNANTEIECAFISFLNDSIKIIGKVTDLPDTTIVHQHFYSHVIGLNMEPVQTLEPVSEATAVVRRKLITFSRSDIITNHPPVFLKVPERIINVQVNEDYTFQFSAEDEDGDSIKYFITSGDEHSTIDSITGLFTFNNKYSSELFYTIAATDGNFTELHTILINCDYFFENEFYFELIPDEEKLRINENSWFICNFPVGGKNGMHPGTYAIVESQTDRTDAYIHPRMGKFSFYGESPGSYTFKIMFELEGDTIFHNFTITVSPLTRVKLGQELPKGDIPIKLYPNPVKDVLTIDLITHTATAAELEVFDLKGSIIDNIVYKNLKAGTNSLKYNTMPLKSGIYIFKVKLKDNDPKFIKIVKE